MKHKLFALVLGFLLCLMANPKQSHAIGLSGANIKAGVNLTRQSSYNVFQGVGGEFDSHQWMVGTSFDLGALFLPKLHFMPGADFAIANVQVPQANTNGQPQFVDETLKIYVINTDFVYFFHQSAKGRGYAGAGIGTHLIRPNSGPGDTKITLNVPIGFQRKLGSGLGWFGELKLVIADDERDSALQFSVGFTLGSLE